MIIKKYKIKNKIKINLEKLLFSEFNFELTNKNTNLLSNIIINENKNLINITIENNKIENIDISDDLLFEDATFASKRCFGKQKFIDN